MKKTQRDCIKFGNLVMEGRDIGTNVFPETDFKYYLDAQLEERSRRRAADGIQENLAARDQRDSQRAAAPLMIALGAKVINNSHMTSEQTSGMILADIRKRLAEREKAEGKEAQGGSRMRRGTREHSRTSSAGAHTGPFSSSICGGVSITPSGSPSKAG